MYFLSKLLPLFVLPLGVSLILIVVGLLRKRRRLAWAGLAVLFVFSNPLVGHVCIRSAEGWAERRAVTETASADAVVVLSAGLVLAPGPAHVIEWDDANRFMGGVELSQAGKAPLLVFTGAAVSSMPGLPTEGEVLAKQAQALGVPSERIVVTPVVLNTADEATEVAAVFRGRHVSNPRVLLVTSAFHMRRARLIFEQAGMSVEPFPVSFASEDIRSLSAFSFLPSVRALSESQTALRELYGRAFYWLKGTLS